MKKRQGKTGSSSLALSCFVYAAGHEEEGVCLILQIGKYRILLDCGVENLENLSQSDLQNLDFAFCSHAHEDHCRGLEKLHQACPQLPVYTSEVTAKLLPFHWLDRDDYALEDLSWYNTLLWRSPFNIAPDLQIELVPAGHLPGAAGIIITYITPDRRYRVMYTGDFSVSNFQLVEGMSIENLRGLAPDVLILEGSYGTVRHPHRRLQEKQLMERIHRAIVEGKNVLLPVPPIGLGQEILKLLRSHHQFTGRDLDIWVDSSVAFTCDVYLELLSQFPASVQNFAKHQSLFWDERICPRMRRLDKDLSDMGEEKPKVLIVDYRSNLWQYLEEESEQWLVLLAEHPQEYLSPNSPKLDLLKNLAYVTTETYLLSEHSDGRNTTQLIHNLRPQHVIFVHGSLNYLLELASLEELRNRYQIHSPVQGILVELPIGDRFVQPKTPQPVYYEGELNEISGEIALTLPQNISNDPRWQNIADTGIIQARWQGDELVVRGLSQRELLNTNNPARISSDLDCCNRCQHYSDRRCWNRASPLYGFKVIPEGYCPVFEAIAEDSYND